MDPRVDDFDPALYGMAAEYDEAGNYKYPEGFDPETNEWLEGFETQREVVGGAVRQGARALGGAPQAGRRGQSRPTPRLLSRRRHRLRLRLGLGQHDASSSSSEPAGRRGRGHARLGRGARRAAREAHRQLI